MGEECKGRRRVRLWDWLCFVIFIYFSVFKWLVVVFVPFVRRVTKTSYKTRIESVEAEEQE
jgi:hypothetical protein